MQKTMERWYLHDAIVGVADHSVPSMVLTISTQRAGAANAHASSCNNGNFTTKF